jgi:N-formylglutamate deformylase
MTPVEVVQGIGPIILGMPHGGTFVPDDIATTLNENGKILADTDWHIARLYHRFQRHASFVKANFHRYVIDANRDPSGVSLYPDSNTTQLVPLTDFDGSPIWRIEPGPAAISERLIHWHQPYHAALRAEIARVKAIHGVVILLDCHSIRSHIPFLFDGKLPDLNIGTFNGVSCHAEIEKMAVNVCENSEFSSVLNGRFKGGWTTRHYGQPNFNIHAIQLEISQHCYMEEYPPWKFLENRLGPLHSVISELYRGLQLLALKPERLIP